MSRYVRSKPPYAPKVEQVEVSEKHVKLRLVLVVVVLMIAAVAFAYWLNGMLTPVAGWQTITATENTPASAEITLSCYLEGNTAAGKKQATRVYTQALKELESALSAAEGSELRRLSAAPNQAATVSDGLYGALETALGEGSRLLFYAPLYDRYNALYACGTDEDAALYDPEHSREAEEYIRALTAFLANPGDISLELLGENRVVLHVSADYAAFCRENEIESLVDFGWAKNAFLLDGVARALSQAGVEEALLTSTDGFSRCLSQSRFGVNLLENNGGSPRQIATAAYNGPGSVATLRSFPVSQGDDTRFYTWEDGAVSPPFFRLDTGRLTAANENLVVISSGEAAPAALRAYETMTDWDFTRLSGFTYLYSRGSTVYCSDSGMEITNLPEGYTLEGAE